MQKQVYSYWGFIRQVNITHLNSGYKKRPVNCYQPHHDNHNANRDKHFFYGQLCCQHRRERSCHNSADQQTRDNIPVMNTYGKNKGDGADKSEYKLRGG